MNSYLIIISLIVQCAIQSIGGARNDPDGEVAKFLQQNKNGMFKGAKKMLCEPTEETGKISMFGVEDVEECEMIVANYLTEFFDKHMHTIPKKWEEMSSVEQEVATYKREMFLKQMATFMVGPDDATDFLEEVDQTLQEREEAGTLHATEL